MPPCAPEFMPPSEAPLLSQASKATAAPYPKSSNVFIVKATTGFLWMVFGMMDFAIWIPSLFCNPKKSMERRRCPAKTVVIVGGNFAGLAALRELQSWQKAHHNESNLRMVLIDKRDYSEYTPGILRLFCEPWYFFKLAQALPENNHEDGCTFERIQGIVTSIVAEDSLQKSEKPRPEQMTKVLTYIPTVNNGGRSRNLSYDYLILATGATYSQPISPGTPKGKQTPETTTLLGRYKEWKRAHEQLKTAKSVLILGGGAVGVELAAEILDHFSDSTQRPTVTIVDAQPNLVPLFPKAVGTYAKDWLKERGAILRLGESLRSWNDKSCTLQDGTTLHADIVYICFGNRPNSEMVDNVASESKTNRLFSLTKRRNVIVKDTLQLVVAGDANAISPCFACGDVASPPSSDEKQAFQAEMQGKLAARNVTKLLELSSGNAAKYHKPRLLRYPMDIAGANRIPLVFVLSLGRYDGVLGFNNFTVPGSLAAIVKWILEYTKILQMRGRLLGNLIWKIGDTVTLFLSRTLFRSSSATKVLVTKR